MSADTPQQCQAVIPGRAPRGSGGISADRIRRAGRHQCPRAAKVRDRYDGKLYCAQHAERDAVAPEPLA